MAHRPVVGRPMVFGRPCHSERVATRLSEEGPPFLWVVEVVGNPAPEPQDLRPRGHGGRTDSCRHQSCHYPTRGSQAAG